MNVSATSRDSTNREADARFPRAIVHHSSAIPHGTTRPMWESLWTIATVGFPLSHPEVSLDGCRSFQDWPPRSEVRKGSLLDAERGRSPYQTIMSALAGIVGLLAVLAAVLRVALPVSVFVPQPHHHWRNAPTVVLLSTVARVHPAAGSPTSLKSTNNE